MPKPRSQKIAIVLPNLCGGGAERVALASAQDLLDKGHEVDLILVQKRGDLLQVVPAGARVIDLKAPRVIASLPPLVRYLREECPDALHAVLWPLTIVGIMAHKLARSPAKLVVSDQVALSRQVAGGGNRQLLEWSTRLFYPLADIRITCSMAAADDLARLSGMARDRIEVIYNPISPPAALAANAKVEAMWGGIGPRIITVGNLKEQKNHALLIQAFARLPQGNARLMILGEGHLRPDLERLAADLGIANRVILPGFFLDPWPFYASADLFALSSDYEGFANVVAEALYAGLQVVSTDCVAGPREILDGGRFGRLVPTGDVAALAHALDRALTERGDLESLRARALAVSGPATVTRYTEILTH